MYKLVEADEELYNRIKKLHGLDNTIPAGMRKADPYNLGLLGSYTPIALEYRQFFKPREENSFWPFGDAPCAYGTLSFFHDGTGVAYFWLGTQRNHEWWEFGCNHKMEHTANLGNCYNRYTCTKCGYVDDVDSSD